MPVGATAERPLVRDVVSILRSSYNLKDAAMQIGQRHQPVDRTRLAPLSGCGRDPA